MAVGETLNVAARLQAAAEPGTVVASEATMALVEGRFDVLPLGPLRLRGVPDPVNAFRVLGRTERPLTHRCVRQPTKPPGWPGPGTRHTAAALGPGQVRPGSLRLDHRRTGGRQIPTGLQLRELAADDPHRWVETSCASYTRMSVLRPVVDLVEDVLSLRSITDPDVRV